MIRSRGGRLMWFWAWKCAPLWLLTRVPWKERTLQTQQFKKCIFLLVYETQGYIIQFKGWAFLLWCARDYLSQLQIISPYKLSSSYHPNVLPFHITHVMLKSQAVKLRPWNKSSFGWQHMACAGGGFLKHNQIYHCQRLPSQLFLSWWLWGLKLIGNYALDKIWDCKRDEAKTSSHLPEENPLSTASALCLSHWLKPSRGKNITFEIRGPSGWQRRHPTQNIRWMTTNVCWTALTMSKTWQVGIFVWKEYELWLVNFCERQKHIFLYHIGNFLLISRKKQKIYKKRKSKYGVLCFYWENKTRLQETSIFKKNIALQQSQHGNGSKLSPMTQCNFRK